MASVIASPSLLYPPNPAMMPYENAPKGGILLNATRATSPRLGTLQLQGQGQDNRQQSQSPVSASFSRTDSASSSENGRHSRSNSVPRKIRFAPLPDPRRAVLVTHDGAIIDSPVQLSAYSDDTSSPVTFDSLLPPATATGGAHNKTPSIGDDNTDTGSDLNGAQSSSSYKKDKRKSWGKRLFQPLLKTGGTAGEDTLWRTASRESEQSNKSNNNSTEALPLNRRLSTSVTEGRSRSTIEAPLTRVQSAGMPPGRQQRLLNGRVYGSRLSSAQNQTDGEPAFIEWGHGGAGSVNSGVNSRYAKVQSGGRLSIGAIGGDAQSHHQHHEEDDGSGMAWVKRRREQKAKEKAEREAREKSEAQEKESSQASSSSPSSPASPSSSPNSNSERSPESDLSHIAAIPDTKDKVISDTNVHSPGATSGPTTSGHPSSSAHSTPMEQDTSLEQHVVTAVTVPMPHPHPHSHPHPHLHLHRNSHHSSLSNSATALNKSPERGVSTPQSEPMLPPLNTVGSNTSAGSVGSAILKVPEISVSNEESSNKSSSSSSSEDEDDDDEGDDADSETDAEDEEEEEQRKTSFCAGVEKVSRHKDQQ